jgi:hypothetical protein
MNNPHVLPNQEQILDSWFDPFDLDAICIQVELAEAITAAIVGDDELYDADDDEYTDLIGAYGYAVLAHLIRLKMLPPLSAWRYVDDQTDSDARHTVAVITE